MPDEIRLDAAGRLGNITPTAQGGARIPASLTRAGVLEYKDPSFPGGMRREWRPSSEVFSPRAIAAIQSLPVIVGHSAWITPANYQQHNVGVVDAGSAKQRGSFLDGMVTVQEQDALRRTDAGELGDLSLGYSLKYTPGAGIVPAGEPDAGKRYDGVQSNLVANHLALLRTGTARAEVGFRFDSKDDPLAGALVLIAEPFTPDAPAPKPQEEKPMALLIRLDSKDYDVSKPEEAVSLQQATDKIRQDARDAIDAKLKADGLIEGYKATIKTLEDTVKDTTRLDSLVANRVALETTARAMIGDKFDGKGKSNREIMIDVIRQDSKDFTGLELDGKTPKPDSFVEGRFDSVVERLPNADSINSLRFNVGPHAPPNMPREEQRRDSRDVKKGSASDRARVENERRMRTAWQGPQAAPDRR
jgi:hypothetical protein